MRAFWVQIEGWKDLNNHLNYNESFVDRSFREHLNILLSDGFVQMGGSSWVYIFSLECMKGVQVSGLSAKQSLMTLWQLFDSVSPH